MQQQFLQILWKLWKTHHYQGDKNISVKKIKDCLAFFEKYPHLLNIRFFLANLTKDNLQKIERLHDEHSITRYVEYMNRLNSAGFEKNESYVRESWNYIKKYCVSKNITTDQYATYKEGSVEAWLKHLKERHISQYILCFFPKICEKILTLDRDWYKFYVEDIEDFYKKKLEVESKIKLTTKLKEIIITKK